MSDSGEINEVLVCRAIYEYSNGHLHGGILGPLDLSDIGSPRVDGLPMLLEDPYVEAALQAPPSFDYVPSPEHPPSSSELPDDRDDMEEEEFLRRTMLVSHEERCRPRKRVNEYGNRRSTLVCPDLSPQPHVITLQDMASMPMMRAAAPSIYILASRSETPPSGTPPFLPIPLPTPSPPLLLPSTDYRADVLEVTLPPRKRLCIAIGPRYEVEESSSTPTTRALEQIMVLLALWMPRLDVTQRGR
ncbi:hypothetical protein Tco_1038318 [Tanacetum coccineum]